MSKITDAEANATSLDGLVNDNALVPTLRNGPKPSYQYLVDGWNTEFNTLIDNLDTQGDAAIVAINEDVATVESLKNSATSLINSDITTVDNAATVALSSINTNKETIETAAANVDLTIAELDSKYKLTMLGVDGAWASGIEFTAYNQYLVYNGTAYQPKPSTNLPYTTGAIPNLSDVQPITVNNADGIILDGGGSVQEYIDGQQFTSVDAVKAYSKLSKLIGQRITTGEYHAGTGYGGASYDVVSAGSVTPNDIDIIQGVSDSGAAIVLTSSTAYAEIFGIKYNENYYDDRFLAMLRYSELNNCRAYFSGAIHLNTNINIASYPNLQLFGVGDESNLYWPDLQSGVGFSTGGVQHTGISIEKMKMSAPPSSGLQVCRFAELYQGCRVSDVIIQGGDIGCEITDSWVSCFDNVYVRDGGTYGLIIRSPSSNEQVNALSLSGIYVQGYQHNWLFDGVTGGGRAIYIPSGASERSRKTSVIIDGFGSVNFGAGFYFEANYTDATGPSGEALDKTKPVDVLVTRTGGVFDATISYDKTYFARHNDFDNSSLIVGTYIDPSVPSYILEDNLTTHVCNTTAYIDFDVYSDSESASVIQNTGKTNSKSSYGGYFFRSSLEAYDPTCQTGFTSTWEDINNLKISSEKTFYIELKCAVGGTTTTPLNIIATDMSTGASVATLTIPSGLYTSGDVLRLRIPRNLSAIQNRLNINSPASGDNVTFETKVVSYSVGENGSGCNGAPQNILNEI